MNVLPACMHMYHVYVVPTKNRRVLLELELQQLWATMKMLWTESWSSKRPASALSHWDISSAQLSYSWKSPIMAPCPLPAPCLSSSDTDFLTCALEGPVLAPGPCHSTPSCGFHHYLPYWVFFKLEPCSCNVLLAIVTWNLLCLG